MNKLRFLTAAVFVVLAITAAGCRSRADQAKANAANAGASDSKTGTKVIDSKTLAIRDDDDFPFAEETHQSYQLSPGAVVRVVSIRGKIEIESSDTGSADVYIVRSVEHGDDLRNRRLTIEHKPDELEIRMRRQDRSALFEIFSEHKSEKQRIVLKLPPKVEVEIEGVNGRVNIGEIEGSAKIEAVNGLVKVGQITGKTSLAGINGEVRVVLSSRNKHGIDIADVNGPIDVLFAGDANADLRVEAVRGRVDPDLPNLVYDGERRGNNFRARAGKGGTPVDIAGVRGKVRIAKATKEELAPTPAASATPTATASATSAATANR